MSEYIKIKNRKRTWTPLQVTKGIVTEGSEETLKRCLSLRKLELPVKEMLSQGLEKDLPDDPGVIPALQSNMLDEDKHDLGFQYVVDAHGVNEKAEREAAKAAKAAEKKAARKKQFILEMFVGAMAVFLMVGIAGTVAYFLRK